MSSIATATESVLDEVLAGQGIGLAAVAFLRPAHRGAGKSPNPATITRWCQKGVRGPDGRTVTLGHVKFGGKILTTEAAVRRFIVALSEPVASVAVVRSPAQRQRDSERASAELEAMGV